MAEVGLVAAIVQLAGLGATLSIQLYKVSDAIGTAGRESRIIAADVALFSQTLRAVGKLLERPLLQTDDMCQIARNTIRCCQPLLDDISDIVRELRPSRLRKSRKQHTPGFISRVKWLFRKPRVESIQKALSSLRANLTLLVASIDLNEAIAARDATATNAQT
jgi:hypothetical protein